MPELSTQASAPTRCYASHTAGRSMLARSPLTENKLQRCDSCCPSVKIFITVIDSLFTYGYDTRYHTCNVKFVDDYTLIRLINSTSEDTYRWR